MRRMRSGEMDEAFAQFGRLIGAILDRYLERNDQAPLDAVETQGFVERLWGVVRRRGLAVPLRDGEMGSPGEMEAAEVGPLVAEVLAGSARASELATPARQLIKACFQPEFRRCRDSYREREPDGTCRRQQWEKARSRVSGSHCVDCPYWTSLTREEHAACLLRGWAGDPAEFHAHPETFLPEEFRALRQFLWLEARKR